MITAKELVKRYCSMFDLDYVEGDDLDECIDSYGDDRDTW